MGEEGQMELAGGGEDLGSVRSFPFWVAARRRFKSDDPMFTAGNMERELLAKQVAIDLTEDERYQLQKIVDADTHAVYCPIVGCGAHLNSLEDFEDHYHARHTAFCSVCSRVYPTSRLLSIHVSEAHDSFFQAKVARGFPMYECLVEGCGMKLKNYRSRQQHLVDKHKFPKSFEFFRKAHPSKHQRQRYLKHAGPRREGMRDMDMDVDKKPSKLVHQRHRPKHAGGKETKETETGVVLLAKQDGREGEKDTEMKVDEKMDDLVSAVSKLSTSGSPPSCIRFGHRHAGGFAFVPRSVRQNKKPTAQQASKD